MNRTDSPAKQPKPFGINGPREILPETTPAGDNTASYNSGFPQITMTLKSAGGLPPKGQDMNQILYELSSLCRWASAGAINTFDSAFATAVGGYPSGSVLISNDGNTLYVNTVDANSTDPNASGAGWKDLFTYLGLTNVAFKSQVYQIANNLSELGFSGPAAQAAARLNMGNVPTKGEVYLSNNNLSEIAAAGSAAQAAARGNLALGSASTRNIGTGASQIPDMGAFQSDLRQTGVQRLPGGYVRQWGVGIPDSSGNTPISFPLAFSSRPFGVYFGYRQSSLPTAVQSIVVDDSSLTNTGFNGRAYMIDGSGVIAASPNAFFWCAEGKI